MPAGNKAEISLTDAHSWVTSSGIIYADLASFSISFNHFNHHSKTQSMHIAAMMKSELLVNTFLYAIMQRLDAAKAAFTVIVVSY